jgi:hypothetical protein
VTISRCLSWKWNNTTFALSKTGRGQADTADYRGSLITFVRENPQSLRFSASYSITAKIMAD